MFAKKRSIVKLREILNPKYQCSFSIDNEKYLMDVDSTMVVDLNTSTIDGKFLNQIKFNPNLNKFRITVNKLMGDGFVSFVDYKEFKNYEDVITYIQSWKEKTT